MPDQNIDSPTTMKTPAAGTPGGKLVGYAEAERIANPDPGPAATCSDADVVNKEIERVTGKSIGELTEEDFYKLPIRLIAQDVRYSTSLSVIMKDPAMTCKWINREHANGARVQRARFEGFLPCTADDVELCHASAKDEHGAYVDGDLVLMKMSKVRYFSKLRENADKAKYNVSAQLSKPFSVKVPGTDNGSLSGSAPFYEIDNSNSTKMVDASQARDLVFNS